MDPRIDKVLKLPNTQKIALLVLVLLLEAAAVFFALYMPKQKSYAELRKSLDTKQNEIADKQKVAKELPKFKKEFDSLNQDLQNALTELPNQAEIPSLLTGITGSGHNAGLEFLLFKPKPEEARDFYAAVPVDITISGSYHQIANFFVAVSNLPRIVNIGNVNFSDIKSDGGRTQIKVTCLATTFRFLDKKEIKNDNKSNK